MGTSIETENKKSKHEFLTKPVLETMEEYYKFEAYAQRPGISEEQKKCTVSPEIFDILSQGQETPFMWIKNVQVFNSETKKEAEALLSKKQAMVII